MSEGIGNRETVVDALARRVEGWRGAGSPWAEPLRELGAVDRAVYEAVAVTATPQLDDAFRQLSTAANYSRLWLGIAADRQPSAVDVGGGWRSRAYSRSAQRPRP